jgi:hypothetical protein
LSITGADMWRVRLRLGLNLAQWAEMLGSPSACGVALEAIEGGWAARQLAGGRAVRVTAASAAAASTDCTDCTDCTGSAARPAVLLQFICQRCAVETTGRVKAEGQLRWGARFRATLT